ASGLFWNTAAQSYGRVQPYLYSLNEPVGARSWIPIQDTPAMRLTYDATVHVPPTHLAVMSADNNPRATTATGVYHYTMAQPIPSYLTLRILEEMNAGDRVEFYYFVDRQNVENRAQFATDPRATLLHNRVNFPWDGFATNSYTKGEIFMRTLEDVLGRTTLDAF